MGTLTNRRDVIRRAGFTNEERKKMTLRYDTETELFLFNVERLLEGLRPSLAVMLVADASGKSLRQIISAPCSQ